MKTTTIYSILLVTGTALAVPTTRGDKVVTISGLSASQNDQMGFITFNLNDPNYHDQTIANVIWDRPGNPQEKATTNDLAYHVHFPDGVKDISAFDFQLQRVNSTEKISVSVNDNRNSCTQATKWICGTATGPVESKKCHYDGDITLIPSFS